MIAMGKYEDENGLKDMMQRSVPDRMIYNGFPGQFERKLCRGHGEGGAVEITKLLWKSPWVLRRKGGRFDSSSA